MDRHDAGRRPPPQTLDTTVTCGGLPNNKRPPPTLHFSSCFLRGQSYRRRASSDQTRSNHGGTQAYRVRSLLLPLLTLLDRPLAPSMSLPSPTSREPIHPPTPLPPHPPPTSTSPPPSLYTPDLSSGSTPPRGESDRRPHGAPPCLAPYCLLPRLDQRLHPVQPTAQRTDPRPVPTIPTCSFGFITPGKLMARARALDRFRRHPLHPLCACSLCGVCTCRRRHAPRRAAGQAAPLIVGDRSTGPASARAGRVPAAPHPIGPPIAR